MNNQEEFLELIRKFRGRIRLHDGWRLTQRSLPFALLAAVLALALGRILPIENLPAWAALPLAAWLVGVWGYNLLRPLPEMAAARRVDRQAGLKERLSSSLYFYAHPETEGQSGDYRPALIANLHGDALETARGLDIRQVFTFETLKKPLLAVAGLALAFILLAALPNPMTGVIADRKAVAAEARRQAEKIEDLKKEVEESPALSEKEKEQLRRQLEELAAQLRNNPGDLEDALADLSKVEESLRPRLDTGKLGNQAAMQALAKRMQELAGKKPSEKEGGDLSAAAEALGELAEKANLSGQSERQEAADSLSALSGQAAQSGASDLAQALAALAEAVRKGDTQGARQAASDAQKAAAAQANKQAQQALLNKTLAQLQNSRQAVAGSCKNPGANGSQPGQGQTSGQGQGQGKGAGGGGGSQANVLPPNTGGAMNLHGPSGSKPVNPADLLGQNVFIPRLSTVGTEGQEMQIGGQDSGQGQEQVTESQNPLPGTNNPALTPYTEVYKDYLDAANQAIDQAYIPADLKDYVKAYFSQLEP